MTLPANDIWVFMDRRGPRLFEAGLNVIGQARKLADACGARVTAVMLAASADAPACAPPEASPPPEEVCGRHGADRLLALEHACFDPPRPDRFAAALAAAAATERPRLILFALSDFGRETAAQAAAHLRAGLIADCQAVRIEPDGAFVATCPAWGGTVLAEIAFAEGWGTGIATLQAHGRLPPAAGGRQTAALERRPVPAPTVPAGLRLSGLRPAAASERRLETAEVVVVGGAGLGSAQGFSRVRELAAALGGEVGATRPPVVQHWVEEERLVGQTGKSVAPKLLVSVGASGAAQYTAGILDAETIVAVDRDPAAPIFQSADVGVAADAHELLPLLTAAVQATAMRRLADALGGAEGCPPREAESFGGRLRRMREARGLAIEALAEATGQTPDFIAQVEAGEITPPVAFLLRLAAAFQVDPGAFLRDEEQAAIRDRRLESYVRRTQHYSYQTLTEGAPSDHLRAFLVTIEPRQAHKPVAYKHEGEEFIFVLSGELEVVLGERAHVLQSGEHLHFNSYTPHRLKNLSEAPTRCLVVLYTL